MLDGARETLDDLALRSADNALIALLGKLDDYRFESRFTTWAYKFAVLEAAVACRRRAWPTSMNMSDSRNTHTQLLRRLLGPAGPELACEQCFDLLDIYVETELGGEEDAELLVPGMRAHLEGCPACAEEHESLRDLVARGD